MAAGPPGTVRIGIGGWTFDPWRETFYPPTLAQARARARQPPAHHHRGERHLLTLAEARDLRGWRDETPEGFVFALKAPRYATNRRVLAEAGPSIERFFASGVTELGDKLGPINWQFMPTKAFDPEDFAAFLKLLPRQDGGRTLRHAVEVRHPSFRTPEFVALARALAVAVVLAGDSGHPQIADPTAGFVYARIMGTCGTEAAGYAPAALDAWASRARALAAGGIPPGLDVVGAPARDSPRATCFST